MAERSPVGISRTFRLILNASSRYRGADLLLFMAAMMLKLYGFDRLIHVRYMDMNAEDALVALGTLALIVFWTLWLPVRGRLIALIGLNITLTSVVYADLIYYRYFQDLISIPVLFQAGQVESLGGSIAALLHASDFLLMADWPFLIPCLVYLLRRGKRDVPAPRRTDRSRRKAAARIGTSAIMFLAGCYLVFGTVNEARSTWAKGLFEQSYWNLSLYNVTGVLGFHGYDAYRYAKQNWFNGSGWTAEELDAVHEWMEKRGEKRKLLEQDELFGAYKGSNVIVVQAEAFQSFMIGRSIGGEEITPTINKLMQDSAYFGRFFHQTAQGRTSDADFAANCSLQPVANGSVFILYARHRYECTPSILGDAGYATAAFHAYDGGFWNRNSMYANMGYGTFYSKKLFAEDEVIGWSVSDKSFFSQSVDYMAKGPQPFYSFLITLSSHHPYTMPESEQKLDTGALEGTMMGDYLQAVHYADAALGSLVERLKAEGLWENTIFVFYGDHDNSIAEWELFETSLGRKLSEPERQSMLKQVPLLVHLPDGGQAGLYGNIGGQLDIAPTILHLLGIPTGDKAMLGTPLITHQPTAGNKIIVFRNGAYTDGKVYYLPSSDGIGSGSCYSLETFAEEADSGACMALAQEARDELRMSDLIVMNDLVPELRKLAAARSAEGMAADAATNANDSFDRSVDAAAAADDGLIAR